jgi:hypothetical protein
MKKAWNKGLTKETHPSVLKISKTMKSKEFDNFYNWREEMKRAGKIKDEYLSFKKDALLAELIGVVLGDGHIQAFPRTERLTISANSNNQGFINRYYNIVHKVFNKKPSLIKSKSANCTRISIYEKFISKRLGVPTGNRKESLNGIPRWTWRNKKFLIGCLRGLYEAEGSFVIHKPTCTFKASFSNKNPKLLKDVYEALQMLKFSPLYEKYRIMISRKKEFFALQDLINFRNY